MPCTARPPQPTHTACGLCLLLACALPVAGTAQTRDVSGELAVSSDLIERGIFVGRPRPIVQGLLSFYDARGWSASAALGMQTYGSRSTRAIVRGAYDGVIDNDWQYQASLQYYAYPGDPFFRLFDRAEATVSTSFRDVFTLGLSAFRYVHTRDEISPMRWALDAGARWPLAPRWSLVGSLGVSAVRPRGQYAYGSVGTTWAAGPWRAELNYLASDRWAQRHIMGASAGRWTVTVIRTF
ncbi:hypothetical protein QRO11_10730 [Paracidovorax citrulli]|uniref:hypothetical protein n=1 Tax=Paracidovorax citrulli TaxID=80869 RepID=UPI00088B72C0|nr:hypothetical protein [Paracidovorax citrulli]UMT88601.1 hypothetical protein FRC90_11345 [Paracidovorax citrulli]WIY36766.1 hypothetical protein QRO11_10730 [Paracidovorax citrulli]SDK43743.1 hypothetical protein SAMN04489709_11670 [Paracidovorax citrulli]